MIENVIFIAIVGLAVTELIFIIALFILNGKISKLETFKSDYEFIRMIQKDNNELIKKICDAVDEERETYEHMYELMDTLCESYTKIYAQYDGIKGQYEVVCANYNHLLKCWDEVAENYQNTYDMFKALTDRFENLMEILEETDADELGDRMTDPDAMIDAAFETVKQAINEDRGIYDGVHDDGPHFVEIKEPPDLGENPFTNPKVVDAMTKTGDVYL